MEQLSVRRDRQQFTEAELTSHCSPAYKNMIYLDTKFRIGTSAGGAVLTRKPNDRLRACFYRAPATDLEVGRFVRGEAFDVAQSRRLRAALTGPGPHRSCPPQREFAVIATSRDHNVTVELGGCWRVLRDDGFGTAVASVVRRVLAPN